MAFVCDQSDSDVSDTDERVEEEQLVTSNQRVYKRGRTRKQTGSGAQDLDTNKEPESDETLLPHRTPSTKAWRQQTHAARTRIHQFTGDKTGMRQNVAPPRKQRLDSRQCFPLVFCSSYYSGGGGNEPVLSTIPGQWTFSSM
jgi:hypothetical protein